MGSRIGIVVVAVVVELGVWVSAAQAQVTPGWECVPTKAGSDVTSGGTGSAPSCPSGSTEVLAPTFVSNGVDGKATVEFSTVNVQVVSGSGATNGAVNGKGNLIVGYAENTNDRTQAGSNDLIVGSDNGWSGYGEIVGGENNVAHGSFATVLGTTNDASGNDSLSAGEDNQADGEASAVLGGELNDAADPLAVIAGGCENLAGPGTPPTGGCQTTGLEAILGGYSNQAAGNQADVSGGTGNLAAGNYSSILGGADNTAYSDCEAIPAAPGSCP